MFFSMIQIFFKASSNKCNSAQIYKTLRSNVLYGVSTVLGAQLWEDFILIFQNLSDIAELPGIDEDLNFSKEIAAKLLQCKAQRYTFNDY